MYTHTPQIGAISSTLRWLQATWTTRFIMTRCLVISVSLVIIRYAEITWRGRAGKAQSSDQCVREHAQWCWFCAHWRRRAQSVLFALAIKTSTSEGKPPPPRPLSENMQERHPANAEAYVFNLRQRPVQCPLFTAIMRIYCGSTPKKRINDDASAAVTLSQLKSYLTFVYRRLHSFCEKH